MTQDALKAYRPELVFWPENSMTFFVDREPGYRSAIATTTLPADVELVAGAPRFEDPDAPVYFNSVFVLAPDGQITGTYDKRRLLPFAEYFPLRTIGLLRRTFGRIRHFAVGAPAPALATRAGAIGVIICNEAMFPSDSLARVHEGAEILANLSNDTWVGDIEFAENQFRIAAVRAVEQRRYLVRASTSGPSGIIEPNGRVQTRSVAYTRAVLGGTVSPRNDFTIYARVGDLFAWLCMAAVALAVIVSMRGRHRA
jgi:apolipoprotein N-acyltransferase